MAQVLLVNPWIYDFAAFDLWAKPLGLLYIADSLRKQRIDVTFIDCLSTSKKKKYGTAHFLKESIPKPKILQWVPRRYYRYGISEEEFLQKLKSSPKPDVILVTSIMTYWYPGVFRAIELLHDHFPNVPIILGGIYATLCYEHAKRFSSANHVYQGKIGKSFFKLLSRYISVDAQNYENFIINARPALDLIRNPTYGVIVTSEGCPYDCSYCAVSILSPSFWQKPYEVCLNEILWICKTFRFKDIAFYDDALLTQAESHFIPLMKKILQSKLDVRFHAPNGFNIREINPKIAHLLKEANFKTIRLGMEITKSDRARIIDNKATFQELLEAIAVLKSTGFDSSEIGVYLLSGLPEQSREEVEESMRKVKEAGARPYLSEFSPIPGTRIWEKAKKISPYPIEEEPLFHNPTLSPCAPEGFTIERFHWRRSILKNSS